MRVCRPLSAPPGWDDPPDNLHATRAVAFLKRLPHTKGTLAEDRKTLGDTWLDWQDRLTRLLFGTVNADGRRLIHTVYAEMPKKTGKSHYAAGLSLYALTLDAEEGGEVYSCAYNIEQAKVVWEIAREMIERDARLAHPLGLDGELEIVRYRNVVKAPASSSLYEPLTKGERGKHGFNPSVVIMDELHEQPNRFMWDTIVDSMGARAQPLLFAITNAGTDRHSICYTQRSYAMKVNDGSIQDPSFLGVVFGASEKADWKKPATWRKAHPGLGVTVPEDRIAAKCAVAKEQPSALNSFLRWQLGIWTQAVTRWIRPSAWDAARREIDWDDWKGRTCYGGLDLGATSDLTAWALAFPDPTDPELVRVRCKAWCPEARLVDRRNPYRDLYESWSREGWLALTPGDVTDYAQVREQIAADQQAFGLSEVVIDINFQGMELAIALQDEYRVKVLGVTTGMRTMSAPCLEFERRLYMDPPKVQHDGNPLLGWSVGNTALKRKPNDDKSVMPWKDSDQAKIDPFVAVLLAFSRAMTRQPRRLGWLVSEV